MDGLHEFLVEQYVPRSAAGGVHDMAERARTAAEQITREGHPVRFVRSIFVPEEETCFYVYSAASPALVRRAAARAGLPTTAVSEAIESDGGR